jgi:hypothetical protein
MKNSILIFTLLTAVAITGCDKKPKDTFVPDSAPPTSSQTAPLPPGHPAINPAGSAMNSSSDAELTQKATVISSQDVPQFTYLEVKQDGQTRWLAASTIAVKKGDVIQFDKGVTMLNFNSKTLNRTFPSITFVNRVTVAKGG